MKLAALGIVGLSGLSGAALLADAATAEQSIGLSPALVEKAIGALVILGGSLEGARRMAGSAKAEAVEAKLVATAADQRASAIGSKVDDLRVALNDERDRLTQLQVEQRRDQQEITRLRDLRHDYIDRELSPRLQRFENGIEEEQERMGARLLAVEALVRVARNE